MIIAKILQRICKPALFLSQIILLMAFGCGPAPTEFVVIFPTATSASTPTMQLLATGTLAPTDVPITSPTETSFIPRAVIKIAGYAPLSGDKADNGQDMMRGAQLAVQQLSGPLNEFSYKVELVAYDDQNLEETALANAQQAVADPEVLCSVGHFDSEISLAASNIYHQAGLAFIAPSDTDPLLTGRSFREINRVIARTDGQGVAAAMFAKEQGFSTVIIVSQKNDISLKNAESFRVESGKLGIQRLGSVVSNLTAENTDKFVSDIINANPELVYISSSANQAIPFLTELRAAGFMGAILGTDKLDSRSTISAAGSSLVQGGGLFYTITNPPAQYYSDTDFFQVFYNEYGTFPHSIAARTYDATGICLKAIEEASIALGGIPPTRADVVKAIRTLKNYEGVTGTYTINSHGDPDPMQYYVYQVLSTDSGSWDQNQIVAAFEITLP
jgi:ABC-type branched-subunit amino acid transport system substrate-binding protein